MLELKVWISTSLNFGGDGYPYNPGQGIELVSAHFLNVFFLDCSLFTHLRTPLTESPGILKEKNLLEKKALLEYSKYSLPD